MPTLLIFLIGLVLFLIGWFLLIPLLVSLFNKMTGPPSPPPARSFPLTEILQLILIIAFLWWCLARLLHWI